ncbi:hypothetical protein ACLOJK_037470 [Asimina triloba]
MLVASILESFIVVFTAVEGTCDGNSPRIRNPDADTLKQLESQNAELKERVKKLEQSISLQGQSERDQNKLLEAQGMELEEGSLFTNADHCI